MTGGSSDLLRFYLARALPLVALPRILSQYVRAVSCPTEGSSFGQRFRGRYVPFRSPHANRTDASQTLSVGISYCTPLAHIDFEGDTIGLENQPG